MDHTTAAITIFSKLAPPGHSDLLSKRICLGADGSVLADGSPCLMANGTATTVPAPDAPALANLLGGLRSCDALALGSIKNANGTITNVVTAHQLAKLAPEHRNNGTIARTREHIDYRPGAPAWLMLDYDRKGMPPGVAGQIDAAGGMWPALLSVAPGLARAARVARASTSAGIFNSETGQRYAGSGGEHHYVLVHDGADVERALQALHERCWLHGFGWFLVGGAGQLLDRSVVDATVRFAERLAFEGAPAVIPPLAQDATLRTPQPFDGEAIDTTVIIPSLSDYERARVAELKLAARNAVEPHAAGIRSAADRRLAESIVQRSGAPFATALRAVESRHRGVLTPEIELHTDHLGVVTVRDVLAEPARFIGETLCDPLEGPAYGYCKARIMRSQTDPSRVFIHSFAHGRTFYELKHDLLSAITLVEKAPKASAVDVMCEVADGAALEQDEVTQLTSATARVTGLGVRVLGQRLKADRERREQKRRRAEAAAAPAATIDRRIHRPAPPPDHELTPIARLVDQTLAADDSEEPPMRDADGRLIRVVTRSPDALHQLTSAGANAEPLKQGEEMIPAPPEPRLLLHTPTSTSLLIEQHIVWDATDKDGNVTHRASLPRPFVDAFMQYGEKSALPHATAVNTAPMVLFDGTILDGVGLDRATGLVHRIEPQLRACLPAGEVTETEARDALAWLLDVWLVDVLADIDDKLVAILLAMTIIQRHLLPARPGFCITAGMRGNGKTTLIMMLAMAVLGRMPAAATWSTNEEERRKALFAYLLQAVALLVWDNLPRGTSISCPHIAKALTTPTYSDRILGVSSAGEPRATTIQVFTGNRIQAGGDMASRMFTAMLRVGRPDPENRTVQHDDPIAWTETHRRKILTCLYTVMVYGCRNRAGVGAPNTRFKKWYQLVGWPVELAASLLRDADGNPRSRFSCVERLRAGEAEDDEAVGIGAALDALLVEFPVGTSFTARAITDIIKAGRAEAATADQVKRADALLEGFAGILPPRKEAPSARTLGIILKARIVERPTFLGDGTTVGILRTWVEHNSNVFRITVEGSGAIDAEGGLGGLGGLPQRSRAKKSVLLDRPHQPHPDNTTFPAENRLDSPPSPPSPPFVEGEPGEVDL